MDHLLLCELTDHTGELRFSFAHNLRMAKPLWIPADLLPNLAFFISFYYYFFLFLHNGTKAIIGDPHFYFIFLGCDLPFRNERLKQLDHFSDGKRNVVSLWMRQTSNSSPMQKQTHIKLVYVFPMISRANYSKVEPSVLQQP